MFFGSLAEQNDVRIIDVSIDGFKEFLEYFYHDDLDVAKLKHIVEVVYLAEKYEVSGYLAAILPFLRMSGEPMMFLELVAKCELPELQEIVRKAIIDEPKKLFESESFVQYDTKVLKMILGWDEVNAYGEEMFMACYRWAKNSLKQRQQQLQQENETIVESEPTPADIREQMNDFFDLIEFSSMKSHTLIMKMVEFADFFTKSDLIAIHKILAVKYPGVLSWLPVHSYGLDSGVPENCVKKIESITFESSKELLFIGYHLSYDLLLSSVNVIYPHVMALTKKSLADDGKDIVLMRKIVRSAFSHIPSDADETIKIQPNAKYEIRLLFANITSEQKLCVSTAFTSIEYDLGNDEKLIIQGNSIISELLFKWRDWASCHIFRKLLRIILFHFTSDLNHVRFFADALNPIRIVFFTNFSMNRL